LSCEKRIIRLLLYSVSISGVKLLRCSIFVCSSLVSSKSASLSGTSLPSLLLLLSSDTFSELLSDSSFSSFVATLYCYHYYYLLIVLPLHFDYCYLLNLLRCYYFLHLNMQLN